MPKAGLGFFLVRQTLCPTASGSQSFWNSCCSRDVLPHPGIYYCKQMVLRVLLCAPKGPDMFCPFTNCPHTPGDHSDCSGPPKATPFRYCVERCDSRSTPWIFSVLWPPHSFPLFRLEWNGLGFQKAHQEKTLCFFFLLLKHWNACRCSMLYVKRFQSQWDQ